MTNPATNRLLIDAASRHWRRRLGAQPWAVLEELALIATPTTHGWSAPIGVRDLGAALGITKNTAARAIATLRTAGIVQPTRVAPHGIPPRPGYILNLPDGVTLSRPDKHDSAVSDEGVCPNREYTSRPGGENTRSRTAPQSCSGLSDPTAKQLEPCHSSQEATGRSRNGSSLQPALFADEGFPLLAMRANGFEEVES